MSNKKKAFDVSLSLEEREAALIEADYDDEKEAFDVDHAPERPLPPGASTEREMVNERARLNVQKTMKIDDTGARVGSLPPNVSKIFEAPGYLNVILDGTVDGTKDKGDRKRIKVRKNLLPEDMYSPEMDHRMFDWFVYFMHPAFGREALTADGMTAGGFYIKRIVELALGNGTKPLPFLRECVWGLVRDRKIMLGGDVSEIPADREPEDDDEDSPTNQGLIALLEWSIWNALQNESRRYNCKPQHILTYGIRFAIDSGVFKP